MKPHKIETKIMNPLIGKAVDAYGHYDGIAFTLGSLAIPFGAIWLLWKPTPYFRR